jgi:MFS family permease
MPLIADVPDVALRARRRVACRILPFVFLLYIINYLDRVNVSFANLRMSTDLGFSDRVYGFGVGMFYVSYVLFEIPGAILVERWSASKWIARIMISWGFITIPTGFVRSAGQFYAVRFLLGVAEASFLPGMIVYLTHGFPCVIAAVHLLTCGDSYRLSDRFSPGGLAPRRSLVVSDRLALALYCGGDSRSRLWRRHPVLHD